MYENIPAVSLSFSVILSGIHKSKVTALQYCVPQVARKYASET